MEIFRGKNTERHWEEKHQKQYKLDKDFNFSDIGNSPLSYIKVAGDIIKENENVFNRKSFLEIGCGSGATSAYLKEKIVPDWYIEAWDFSKPAILSAIKKQPNVKYKVRDFLLNPIEKDYGIVAAFETIEHVEEGRNYEVLNNMIEHSEYTIISTPNTQDDCFGEHISHYTFTTFKEKGYDVVWKHKLATIDMQDGQYGKWFYMIFLIKGKLK